MDPAMVVTVASAVIGAVGTVVGALIQVRGRRSREDQSLAGGAGRLVRGGTAGAGLAVGRDVPPDDRW
jgi:hypothetical protein